MEKKNKAIRADLDDDLSIDLEDIKKFHGISSDADMIRFLIRKEKKDIIQSDVYNLLDKHGKS